MEGFLLGVGASVLGALLFGAALRASRIRGLLRLQRIARIERKETRRLLTGRFEGDVTGGWFRRPGEPRWVDALADSFRLEIASPSNPDHAAHKPIIGASRLVDHVSDRDDVVYLVNAESGYGKTALGLTLTLLYPGFSKTGLFPLYIDLGKASSEQPLEALDALLRRLKENEGGQIWGRPLFVFDALNETIDPENFADALERRRDALRNLRAHLLFLFSFRHRSYPQRLRVALVAHGFVHLEHIELKFDVGKESDLGFFPSVVQARSGSSPAATDLAADLQHYAARFPTFALSREDVAAYLNWRYSSATDRRPDDAPSPASLRFPEVVGEQRRPGESLFQLAHVAFVLLSQEVTAMSLERIVERVDIEERDLREFASSAGVIGLAQCGKQHLRFADEITVRVLGALHVARQLQEGRSVAALRGRTIYDVCAPYVQPALQWLAGNSQAATAQSAEHIATTVSDALSGRDAPYSFYAGALCSEDTGVLGDYRETLSASLFHAMIVAIDEDREQTCRGSLKAAGNNEPEPVLEPVLDQLFEVMDAYGKQAVNLLLERMTDEAPLVRSQAAYLLLDWVHKVSDPLASDTRAALAEIASRIDGGEKNLHVRFHQVEILEQLLGLFPANDSIRQQTLSILGVISIIEGDSGGTLKDETIYSDCQELVSVRARQLVESTPPATVAVELRDRVEHCIEGIRGNCRFQSLGGGAEAEARLECWEVALAFSAQACRYVRRSIQLTSFVEGSLDHKYWIVRWWAFGGLLEIARHAAIAGDGVLAKMCAQRTALQLFTGVEPMGLKHRQCAVVERSMRNEKSTASRALRGAVADNAAICLTIQERQKFSERYYKAMGTSPDDYLSEFFRRLEEIVPAPFERSVS